MTLAAAAISTTAATMAVSASPAYASLNCGPAYIVDADINTGSGRIVQNCTGSGTVVYDVSCFSIIPFTINYTYYVPEPGMSIWLPITCESGAYPRGVTWKPAPGS
ncbi:hypothetical protein [Micromonospora parva]|uniref:hypothetical protein n=1 Tax=Micromonospora parva TaxID=1464048 RepID=UPI0036609AD6